LDRFYDEEDLEDIQAISLRTGIVLQKLILGDVKPTFRPHTKVAGQ